MCQDDTAWYFWAMLSLTMPAHASAMGFVIATASINAAACGVPKLERTTSRPGTLSQTDWVEAYWKTGGFRFGEPRDIQVSPDGRAIFFLRSSKEDPELALYQYDVDDRAERKIADATSLLDGDAHVRPSKIVDYQLSNDGTRILVPLGLSMFVFDRDSESWKEFRQANPPQGAQLSPDGTHVAFVLEGDLMVTNIDTGSTRRLTARQADGPGRRVEYGIAEFIAREEMERTQGFWWSPDGAYLLYQKTDYRGVARRSRIDPAQPDALVPPVPYPRAGTKNADVSLELVSTRATRHKNVSWDREHFPYLVAARWPVGQPPYVVVQNRTQTKIQILRVNQHTGATKVIHEERDPRWINIDQSVPVFLADGSFLWSSERSGWYSLERRFPNGNVVPIAKRSAGYRKLLHVDAQERYAWIASSAEPSQRQILRVPIQPGTEPPRAVTHTPGVHHAFFHPRANVWVHQCRERNSTPTWWVRRKENLRRAHSTTRGQLSIAEALPVRHLNTEYVVVGAHRLRAAITRPGDFSAHRRYPVLLHVYGGPGHNHVLQTSHRQLRAQLWADQGFIVLQVDGRGTPGRGRRFERAIKKNLIDGPLTDQLAALRELGTRHPELDLSRVGIVGWSFGGYVAAMATLRHPDLFRVGVAGAPVVDWREYDTHYTERYLGLPASNPRAYDEHSALRFIGSPAKPAGDRTEQTKAPLMIVHGTADDNVFFLHSLRLSEALTRADHDHVLIPLSGSTHHGNDPQLASALFKRIVRFLKQHTALE